MHTTPASTQSVALTIAGSDPSGGAGLQADLKTFHQHGVYGMSVVTLLTVQNTRTVSAVEFLSATLVLDQLDACLSDIPPQAAKTGALGSPKIIAAIAEQARRFSFPLVVDPVMISKHNIPLLETQAVEVLVQQLFPCAYLVTPNLPEAAKIIGREITNLQQMKEAAKQIADLGPQNVFLKGGHLSVPAQEFATFSGLGASQATGDDHELRTGGISDRAIDVLYADGEWFEFEAPRVATKHTHGTGCTTSAAITALLAKGVPLITAIERAKKYITTAIQSNPGLGGGYGPVNFFADPAE